jgi:hypothetical protein
MSNLNNRTLIVGEDDSAIVLHDKTGELEILIPPHLDKRDDMPIGAMIITRFAEKLGDPVWVRTHLLDNLNGPSSPHPIVETK